jgi:hypothetical protein
MEDAGLEVVHRYNLPESRIHDSARVEITAKRENGYHGEDRK